MAAEDVVVLEDCAIDVVGEDDVEVVVEVEDIVVLDDIFDDN